MNEEDTRKAFRSSLEDSIAILRRLSPKCDSVADLVGMLELAVQNNGQLTMLMEEISPTRLRIGA